VTISAYDVVELRKIYRSPPVVANDGISFSVAAGTAFGLLGPNGAGKTTLVKQLVGLLRPTSGQILLFGESIDRSRQRIGRHVAYLPQAALSLGDMKVREAVQWTGMLRGLGRRGADVDAAELMDVLELGSLADRQLRKLSGGERRLTQIAMTLAGRLSVLILDEPTSDIDPSLRARIWGLIGERVAAGSAVILVTHDVAEAENALDHVAILDEGRVVASGRPAELKGRLAHRSRLEVTVAEGGSASVTAIANLIGVGAQLDGRRISAWVPADEAVMLLDKVVTFGGPNGLEDVRLVSPTLEDVYLDVCGHGLEVER
jgi:ABC-type multidrug transport system ATPase subunit